MKINKFNERYEIDEEGEIAEEYAKFILAEYLDKKIDGVTLEDVFRNIMNSDEVEEDHEYIVKQELVDLTHNLSIDAPKIRKQIKIESDKYNI